MDKLVIVPTYNELDNVEPLIARLLALPYGLEVLVVDDGSPDGTGDRVRSLMAREPRIHLIERGRKLGLGSAYLSLGPAWGWAAHFAVGTVLAIIFARWFRTRLPGPAVVQGLLYGALVFLVAQLVFLPLVGSGVFSHGDLELIAGSGL